jgi:hypothetical protein
MTERPRRCLRTAVWPILQDLRANTGRARTRGDRLFPGKQTGLGQRRALLGVSHGCNAIVLLPFGRGHCIYG